jgi:hypothetical protein
MDKLEAYVDQVCRGIAGTRGLRQHIRLELLQHLRDAVAEHQAAGLAEPDAINRALEDFGGPEQVRAELEATHGHRLMTVVLDKALLWKEKTMKARWLWSTGAHLTCCLLIVAQILFIAAAQIFFYPKFREMAREGWIAPTVPSQNGAINLWALNTLYNLREVYEQSLWIGLAALLAWILFEWRFRGDNKILVRLSALGTLSLGLFIPVAMTAAALVLPLILIDHRKVPQEIARTQIINLEASVNQLNQAVADKNWGKIANSAQLSRKHLQLLADTGVGTPPPWSPNAAEPTALSPFAPAITTLKAVETASRRGNQPEFDTAFQQFQVAYAQLKRGASPTE